MLNVPDLFDRYVHGDPNSGCWLWAGPVNWGGYGRVTVAPRRRRRAHHVFFEHYKGSIPDGLQLLHKCDTPACVNPDHIRLGTLEENMADKVAKGRQAKGAKLSAIRKSTSCRGEKNKSSKLTTVQVLRILSDPRPAPIISKEYGVSHQHISRLKRRERWGHLQEIH